MCISNGTLVETAWVGNIVCTTVGNNLSTCNDSSATQAVIFKIKYHLKVTLLSGKVVLLVRGLHSSDVWLLGVLLQTLKKLFLFSHNNGTEKKYRGDHQIKLYKNRKCYTLF